MGVRGDTKILGALDKILDRAIEGEGAGRGCRK